MKPSFRVIEMALAAMITVSPIGAVAPAWANGPNTANPAGPPATPPPVITRTTTHTGVGQGGCKENYTGELNSLADQSLALQKTGATAAVAGVVANTIGLTARGTFFSTETVAWDAGAVMSNTLLPAPNPGNVDPAANLAFSVAAAASGVAGALNDVATTANVVALGAALVGANAAEQGVDTAINRNTLSQYQATLPYCDEEFTGTVNVSAGGVNVTGASLFNDDVGVTKDVNVEQDVNANQVHASQGISADNGNIWLGDPNGTTYSDGITIGGGAVSGAGSGQPLAVTGDVDAIAIGNNAKAMMAGSVTLGLNSSANGLEDVVIGAQNETGTGGNNTVVGNEIDIIGSTSSDNTVLGVGHQVTGSRNFVGGDPNTVVGNNNVATGFNINVTGDDNVAIGNTVTITGNRAVAIGNNASASADDTTAIGDNAQANATGSAAFGRRAVAQRTNQQVFGTVRNTYTNPGITSKFSKSRQAGALEVVTSDSAGNLATDNGEIFETLSENQVGVAIAMAMINPALRADERFGVAVNWGIFEDSQAVSLSGLGVVAQDLIGMGETIAFTGGFGVSVKRKEYGGRESDTVFGGRAGFQVAW